MKKKIIKIILSSGTLIGITFIVLLIPILMLLDFFGANIVDDYVENNSDYSEMYLSTVNKYLTEGKGYVSLDRILYFYLENDKLTFDQIYEDNLDSELKQVKPISEVCQMSRYSIYSVCKENELNSSNQIDEMQNKPFSIPLDLENMTATSYFMEERIIYDKVDIHPAWDFATSAEKEVYAVCDGVVEDISFNYLVNEIDTSGGYGNYIKISCDDTSYQVLYGHLYPNSTTLKIGDSVSNHQLIAEVGTTGYSTGNHLHFEVFSDRKTIDGLSLLDFTNPY